MLRYGVFLLLACTAAGAFAQSSSGPPAKRPPTADPVIRAIPAPRDFHHRGTIWMEYHPPSGFGSVDLRPLRVAEDPPVTLAAAFAHKGERLTAPPAQVSLAVRTWAGTPRYAKVRELVFTLNETERVAAGPLVRQQADTVGGVTETLALRMPVAVFLRIANARQAAVEFGGTRVALGEDVLEALRDFASRMTPAGYERARAAAQATVAAPGMTVRKDWYEPGEVDERAAVAMLQKKPTYPDLPPRERRVRTVLVEYVVDTTGRVDPASVRSPSPDEDPRFVESVRAVAAEWEFTPARKGGRPVRQIVRQALLFEP